MTYMQKYQIAGH